MRWDVRKSATVVAYTNRLDALPGLNEAIAHLFDGLPDGAMHLHTRPDGIEAWRWLEARHWIIFTVDCTVNRRIIRVIALESATEGAIEEN